MYYHTPVLLEEAIAHLKVSNGGKYIDATLGDGGHSIKLLELGAQVLGMDYNSMSVERAVNRIRDLGLGGTFKAVVANFKDLEKTAKANDFIPCRGVLYDLGWSSSQLDDESGLSFNKDEPLDMRLDKSLGVTAADLVNALSQEQLTRILFEFSSEKLSARFAKAIILARKTKPFVSTADLAKTVVDAAPLGYEHGRIHPATRVFQALRIAVNSEFENLKDSLPQAARVLLPRGRIVVISFHSLEDRIIKQFGLSVQPDFSAVTKKPVVASGEEIARNIRARSAKLRVFEKK